MAMVKAENWRLYNLKAIKIKRETAKAYLVEFLNGKKAWLPKSRTKMEGGYLAVQEWLVEKNKLPAIGSVSIEVNPKLIKNEEGLRGLLEKALKEPQVATYRYCVSVLTLKKVIYISPELKEEVGSAKEFITIEVD